MARYFSLETGSRFRRNFLGVAKANIIAQALAVVFSPILTRLYSPSDFGTLTTFTAALGVLAAFATWRFDWSIPNAQSELQVPQLAILGVTSLILTAIASFVVLLLFAEQWTFWRGFQALGSFSLLIPLALVGQGLFQLLQAWFVRSGDLLPVSRATISQKLAGTGLSLAGGFASLGASGLVFSSLISSWIGIRVLMKNSSTLVRSMTTLRLSSVAATLRAFGPESCVSVAVSTTKVASVLGIPILLINFFSLRELGWYALMNRIALMPSGFITNAMAQSFWSEASQLVATDKPRLKSLYLKTAKHLSLVSIIPLVLCLAGPFYVAPLFGDDWQEAGFVLVALAPWIVARIIVQPITHLIVHRKQHWKLFTDGAQLLAIVAVISLSANYETDFVHVILYISMIASAAYAILFVMNLRCLAK